MIDFVLILQYIKHIKLTSSKKVGLKNALKKSTAKFIMKEAKTTGVLDIIFAKTLKIDKRPISKPHQCNQCHLKFINVGTLNRHKRVGHQQKKIYWPASVLHKSKGRAVVD